MIFREGDYVRSNHDEDKVYRVSNPDPNDYRLGKLSIYVYDIAKGFEVCSSKHSLTKIPEDEVMILKLAGKLDE